MSLVCTWYGGILGIGESVTFYGLGTWLLLGVPYYVFALVYAIWLSKKVQISPQFSIPEMLGEKYGLRVRKLSGVLVFLLAVPAAHILMVGTIVHGISGQPILTSMIIAAVFGAALLYRGGLLADVRMSILSFFLMYIAFAILVGQSMMQVPFNQMVKFSMDSGMWSITGNQSPVQVLGFFLLGAWTIVDPGFHQRVASAATPKIGQRTVLTAIIFWMIFDVLMITAGLYALTFKVQAATPLELFPAFANQILPPGLKAIFICGVLGTTLCAMVGYLLLAGSTLGRDVFGNSWKAKTAISSSDEVRTTRIGIIVSILIAIALAFSVKSVVALWYSFGGIVVGSLLIPVLCGYLQPKGKTLPGVFSAILLSSLVASTLWAWGLSTGNPYLEFTIFNQERFGFGTLVPGLFVSIVVLVFGKMNQQLTSKSRIEKENL